MKNHSIFRNELGENQPRVLFCSDQHHFHEKIVLYCNRPFLDADDMNCQLVKNFQAKVNPEDVVYFLGDFAMAPRRYAEDHFYMYRSILDELPGHKHLLRGNHDHLTVAEYLDMGFETVEHVSCFKQQNMVLTHDPKVITKPYAPKGDFNWVVGHVHGAWTFRSGINALNVSVDQHDFVPITFEEANVFFKNKLDI